MKKILVPTDFSSCAADALSVAVQIASRSGGELYILHLDTAPDLTVHAGRMLSAVADRGPERQVRAELFRMADEVEHQGLTVHTILVEDTSGQGIIDYLLPYGIELIVMGSHGHKGLRDRLLGSMARKVVRESPVPVLVIHGIPEQGIRLRDFMFASTFRKDQSAAIRSVAGLVALFGGTLHVVYINLYLHLIREEVARETVAALMVSWPELRHTVTVSETNDETFGIRNFANLCHADMIAVSMEHQTLPGRILNPAVAERLIKQETRPLLILPPS